MANHLACSQSDIGRPTANVEFFVLVHFKKSRIQCLAAMHHDEVPAFNLVHTELDLLGILRPDMLMDQIFAMQEALVVVLKSICRQSQEFTLVIHPDQQGTALTV